MHSLKTWLLILVAVGGAVYYYAPPQFWPLVALYLAGELAVAASHYLISH